MIFAYSAIALFIAWIWLDYFRFIDIYDKTKLKFPLIAFGLGALTPFLLLWIQYNAPAVYYLHQNGDPSNDFLFYFLNVGIYEELMKLLPFLLFLVFLRKELREPIDYILIIAASALGFAATENAMYFQDSGPTIIAGRAILSAVGHMFDTVLIAYGFILVRFHKKHNNILLIPLFFVLAALSHGFYDFWLTIEGGFIVTIAYFLVTISWFAMIMNNALNNSSYFDYKKYVHPNKVAFRILTYYGVLILLQFILESCTTNFESALYTFLWNVKVTGIIMAVAAIRLSRFKLIQNRWFPFKVELPFSFSTGDSLGMRSTYMRLRIKGSGDEEATMSLFYKENVFVYPVSKRNTHIGGRRLGHVTELAFLQGDEVFYELKIYDTDENGSYSSYLVKPKNTGTTMVNDKYPIVALFDHAHVNDWKNPKLSAKNFKFKEWGYLKLQAD